MFTETVADKLAYDDWLVVRQSSDRLIGDSQIREQYMSEINIHYIPTGKGVCGVIIKDFSAANIAICSGSAKIKQLCPDSSSISRPLNGFEIQDGKYFPIQTTLV